MQQPILQTIDLHRSFGGTPVLRGLDISVCEGEIYGLLGRNGAGKTTTLRSIMGIISADRGKIALFGDIVAAPTNAQKRMIGFVSQEQHFYDWMTCRVLGDFVGALYPTWDLKEFVRLLNALDVPLSRKVSALSVGMKRKLGLALALAHRPQLLILDEPTAGLDPIARREFLEMVQQQARDHGRTTLFSTHRIDEAEEFADTIGILEGGRTLFEGPLETLQSTVRAVPEDQEALAEELGLERMPGKTRAGDAVFRGDPEKWDSVSSAALDLERAFIAMTTKERARL